jgi:3-hydroxybutyryl-CoA dehydrogenase
MGIQITKLFLKEKCQVFLVTRNIDRTKVKLGPFFVMNSSLKVENLFVTDSIMDLKSCDFIFECSVENLQIKKDLISRVLKNSHAIVGSCTSTFTLEEISKGIELKKKLNIIHFSNPISAMKVVEIVYSSQISSADRYLIEKLLKELKFLTFEVPDIPGFIINSLLFPLIYNAIQIHYHHGVPKTTINELMKNGCGFPMGPFEIIDLVGVNTVAKVLENLGYALPENLLESINTKP